MIVKYTLDLGDTVQLMISEERKYVCNDCGYVIAKQRIAR
jgi:hypothetical protein